MTITLNKPEVNAQTTQDVTREGKSLQDYIDKAIAEAVKNAPPPLSRDEQREKNQAAIALLHQWREEDKTDDPEEIARREAEWEEFRVGMNAAHTSDRVIYP